MGGGTLVGLGAVMMVTPLHPIGHAMAIGGVAVLGGFRGRGEKKEGEDDSNQEEEKPTDEEDVTKTSDASH